jgi:uncharacterized protein YcbK (DUF882 family)
LAIAAIASVATLASLASAESAQAKDSRAAQPDESARAEVQPRPKQAPGVNHWPPILPVALHQLRPVDLIDAKTGSHYRMLLIDAKGEIRLNTLDEMRDFLACRKTQSDHPIHPRLLSLIHAVAAAYPGRSLIVHSGYRHPDVSHHAKRSNHTRGRAIDFRVQGVSNRELFERLRHSFAKVGVGYYPNSAFVHLDVREDETLWVDYAGPGESACYSKTPAEDLRTGIVETLASSAARSRGCRGQNASAKKPRRESNLEPDLEPDRNASNSARASNE